MNRIIGLAALAALAAGGAAQAHVILQPAQASPGAEAALRFVVGHGCKDQPTTALRVELPPGVKLLSAEPKTGWTLAVEGASVTWRGELAAHQADSFGVKTRLPSTPGRLAFVVAQSCGVESVRWDQPYVGEGPKPAHPAPSLLIAAGPTSAIAVAPAGKPPTGVQMLNGAFADAAGRPLYTFDHDTMVGMSHCEGECAQMWPPLIAPKAAKPAGDWSLVTREDGSRQWAYRTKPLYTYSKDQPGGAALGAEIPNWKLAR